MKKLPKFMLTRRVDLDAPAPDKSTTVGKKRTPGTPGSRGSPSTSQWRRSQKSRSAFKTSTRSPVVKAYAFAEQALYNSIGNDAGRVEIYSKLDPNFKKTLIDSLVEVSSISVKKRTKMSATLIQRANSIIGELARVENVVRVGILDMGVWIGGLPILLEKLNASQLLFIIFEIQAAVPGGLVKTPEGMANWAFVTLGRNLTKAERKGMRSQMIADEFFVVAEDIRKNMGLDLLVGLTPEMVAGIDEDGGIYWNHFSTVSGQTILLSTTDLREFSEKAGRSFEAGVGSLLLGALLIAVNNNLGYHEEINGCLFDYNEDRASLIGALKSMRVDSECLNAMNDAQRVATVGMLKALKSMKRRKS